MDFTRAAERGVSLSKLEVVFKGYSKGGVVDCLLVDFLL